MDWNKFSGNRNIVFVALTGSHNYNLNTANSDRDYKAFVLPTYDDLYHNRMFSNSITSPKLDATAHDVRKLPELWWKANLNFIEVLYSMEEQVYNDGIKKILRRRDEFATMNIPYLYNATFGMYMQKINNLHKGTETTNALIEKFGYDTKEACHAVRCLMFLYRFNTSRNIGDSLWFNDNEEERTVLMNIKNGKYTEEGVLNLADYLKMTVEMMRDWYMSRKPKPELKEELDNLIKELVRENLFPSL